MRRWENPRLKQWERLVTGCFPSRARVLDVGCGMGREAFVLTDMGFRVTGIDISREVIRQVSALFAQRGYTIPFILYDGHALPFEAESFDAIVIWAQTFGLLHGDAYKQAFLSECKRVLAAGGLLSFSGHDRGYLLENYRDFVRDRKFYPYADTELYWETFDESELGAFARNAGYTVALCERGDNYKPEDGPILHCLCRK